MMVMVAMSMTEQLIQEELKGNWLQMRPGRSRQQKG
jgi:hypothetical protein